MKLKKMLRKLGVALASVMLLGSVMAFSAFAAANTRTVLEDSFESYSDTNPFDKAYDGDTAKTTIEADNGNHYITFQHSDTDTSILVEKLFHMSVASGVIDSGIIDLKYSVKPAAGLSTLFRFKNGSEQTIGFPYFNDGYIYLDWNNSSGTLYTPEEWYNVKVSLDLFNKKYDISVNTQNDDEVLSQTGVALGDNTIQQLDGIVMQVWGSAEGKSCFDNIEIKYTPAMPYEQNFESIEAPSLTMRAGVIGENGSIIDGDNGTKVFKLEGTGAYSAPELQFNIGEIGYGELIVEADMKTGNEAHESLILLRNGDSLIQTIFLDSDSGIRLGYNGYQFTDNCDSNTWYHIKLTYNLDKGTMDAKVSGDGNVYVKKDYAFETALKTVKSINFQTWDGGSAYIDNVKISYITIPYEQDFEVGIDGLEFDTADTTCGVVEYEGKKVYKLASQINRGSLLLIKDLGETSDGKIYVDTDIYPGTGAAQMFVTITNSEGKTDLKNLIGFSSPDGVRCGWNEDVYLSTYTTDTWYHINMEIDVETGKLNGTITDENGTTGSVTGKQLFDAGYVVNNIYFQLFENKESETYSYLDNIQITDSSYIKLADVEVTNNSAKATVIVNDAEKRKNDKARVILAVYEGNRMVAVKTQKIADYKCTVNLEVNYSNKDASGLTVKAYLWNFNNVGLVTECVSEQIK